MRKYYNERECTIKIDFNKIKNLFLRIYKQFFYENYFVKEGFSWAYFDPELYLFGKIGIWNIWPFEENIETYDEATLFSVIEFLYDCVSNKTKIQYYKDNYDAQKGYRNFINDILKHYNGGYELSEDGEIKKLPPSGFEPLMEVVVETDDPENIDLRVRYAISKYSYYGASIEDKKEAIITLAGVLEYLKDIGITLPKNDDSELFNIINNFDIRHHKQVQKGDYNKEVWYDWMFYTFLASIHTLLKLKKDD